MSNLDNCCITDYWSCCESSISTNKFYAFSAETEEHFEKIEQEIADIEASGLTYEGGDYIKIEGNVISVSGLQDDIATLSGNLENKQDTLISGTNIKTINNTSLLGEGNIVIQGGGTVDSSLDINSDNAVANSAITTAINTLQTNVNTISGNTENKQDKLTEGSFIDIDNSNTISAKIQVLSRAAWEALTTKDPTVLYLIKQD